MPRQVLLIPYIRRDQSIYDFRLAREDIFCRFVRDLIEFRRWRWGSGTDVDGAIGDAKPCGHEHHREGYDVWFLLHL